MYRREELEKVTGVPHEQYVEGDVAVLEQGDSIGCCDCGLVHRVALLKCGKDGKVLMKLETDHQMTKIARETRNFVCKLGFRGERNGEDISGRDKSEV